MNKLKIIAIIFLITLVSGSCKKDYPKDIPDWLKDKIKVMNKESKGKGCVYECRAVYEYKNGTDVVYWLKNGNTPITFTIYDISGNVSCTFPGHDIMNAQCGSVMVLYYIFVREIWKEN